MPGEVLNIHRTRKFFIPSGKTLCVAYSGSITAADPMQKGWIHFIYRRDGISLIQLWYRDVINNCTFVDLCIWSGRGRHKARLHTVWNKRQVIVFIRQLLSCFLSPKLSDCSTLKTIIHLRITITILSSPTAVQWEYIQFGSIDNVL